MQEENIVSQIKHLYNTKSIQVFCHECIPRILSKSYENGIPFMESLLDSIFDICLTGMRESSPVTQRDINKCNYIFQENDLAINCKSCQHDETCVLCIDCYENGDHKEHEVYCHVTMPGGVCDCGDEEAWDPSGFCEKHRKRSAETETSKDVETFDEEELERAVRSLPENERRLVSEIYKALVQCMNDFAQRTIESFCLQSVQSQGRTEILHYSKSLETCAEETSTAEQVDAKIFHVRISNDDVHSDEQLVQSLLSKNIELARQLTHAIDTNGSSLIRSHLDIREAKQCMEMFKLEGWHVSIISDRRLAQEKCIIAIIRFIKRFCQSSLAHRVLFCEQAFAWGNQILTSIQSRQQSPIKIWLQADPYLRKEIVLELYGMYLLLQSEKALKIAFSFTFIHVYERLMIKYLNGIGTRNESISQYGVRIFTTSSIVVMLQK